MDSRSLSRRVSPSVTNPTVSTRLSRSAVLTSFASCAFGVNCLRHMRSFRFISDTDSVFSKRPALGTGSAATTPESGPSSVHVMVLPMQSSPLLWCLQVRLRSRAPSSSSSTFSLGTWFTMAVIVTTRRMPPEAPLLLVRPMHCSSAVVATVVLMARKDKPGVVAEDRAATGWDCSSASLALAVTFAASSGLTSKASSSSATFSTTSSK
mmetsp:Transcript_13456/g.31639  ORF Transcript_13456/g.31639 Transcript_13456/m.31639 type:complete len:209 (+) Transcript_13456:1119-1745(+)